MNSPHPATGAKRAKRSLCAAFVIAFSASVFAQNSGEIPEPKEPFIAAPAERARWEVIATPRSREQSGPDTTKPTGEGKAGSRYIKRRVVTRTGEIAREIQEWSDGGRSVLWMVGELLLVEPADSGPIQLINPRTTPFEKLRNRAEFEGFEWLHRANYRKPVPYKGRQAYLFEGKARRIAHTVSEEIVYQVKKKALVDVQTGLPILLDDGSVKHEFHFFPTPSAPLVLPPAVEARLREHEAAMNIIRVKKPARNF